LEIVVDLLSQDAVKVRAGARAYIENWGGSDPLNARVRLVEPSGFTKYSALGVEEQRVNVIIDLANGSNDWKGLQDAYRVEPRIVVWQSDAVLQVPLSALFREGSDWAVYKLDGSRAELLIVEIGQRNRDFAQVLSGLDASDRVILHPSEDVSDGSQVATR
jgi:HlyD family secretion protein